MNIKDEILALLREEGIPPHNKRAFSSAKYLAGMNALYRKRPDLCQGREFIRARQAVIENAKGKGRD